MLRKFIKSTVIVTIFLLSGCTLVPGGHLDVGLLSYDESYDISPKVNVRYITPDLVKELEALEPNTQINQALTEDIDKYSYIIGKGDILNITVWDHPELTTPAGQFRSAGESGNVVHSDGAIFYPYVGRVSVFNKSVDEVRDLITKKLSLYIESPQVDVSVARYQSQRVFVTGEVKVPAVLPITNVPMTLLDALSLSGGMSVDADWRSVVLTSSSDEQIVKKEVLNLYALYQKGDMSQNRLLSNNDIVHVPRNDFLKVFVMGDVMDLSLIHI